MFMSFICMYAYVPHVYLVSMELKRGHQINGIGIMDGFEPFLDSGNWTWAPARAASVSTSKVPAVIVLAHTPVRFYNT